MVRHLIILFLLAFSSGTFRSDAQIIKKAGGLIQSAFDPVAKDTATVGTPHPESEREQFLDSVRFREMELQIQEMKLNEILLREELDRALSSTSLADSLKKEHRKLLIDSLRAVSSGAPVIVESDTLYYIYAARGGYSAFDRATMTSEALMKAAKKVSSRRDSVHILDNDDFIDIMYGDKVIASVTDLDAAWLSTSRRELAEMYAPILAAKISDLKEENSFWRIVRRGALFVGVLIFQYLLFRLTNFLFRKLRRQIIRFKQQKLRPVIIRDYELLNTSRLCRMLIFLSNLLRYFLLLLQLMITVPILFAIFPQTEKLAMTIVTYIMEPVRMVLKAIAEYIPNLFIILVIWYCIRYIIKGLRYISDEIQSEKLRISGFYPDWARPTFNIIRFLLYAFMIAMIYPYLPGAESGVFQGISVFVGLIVSLGSSTVIANFIAGFVITYMRPFKVGDLIKTKDTVGNVIEKTPFVTRLRTIKNEVVTIPNAFIMSSHTVNYSASARQYGLIIHTALTMGYDVPWRRVHELLIDAALHTPGVLPYPEPFVLETELNDNYMCYQINAYIRNADKMPEILSDLHQNIQDLFHNAGIDLVAPHYYAPREGGSCDLPRNESRHDSRHD